MGICSQVEIGDLSTKLCQALSTLPSSHITCSHTGFPVTNDAYQILWQWQASTGWVLLPTSVLSLHVQGVVPSPRFDKAASLMSEALRHGVYSLPRHIYLSPKGRPKIHRWLCPTELRPTGTFSQHQHMPKCLQGYFPSLQWPVLPWSAYLPLSTSIENLSH